MPGFTKNRRCSLCFTVHQMGKGIWPVQFKDALTIGTRGGEQWQATVHFVCTKCREKRAGQWRRVDEARASQLVPTLRCITLQEPYAWLLVHGFKDVENRSQHFQFFGRVLIHSARTIHETYDRVCQKALLDFSVIVPPLEYFESRLGSVVGVARFDQMQLDHNSPWKIRGQWCFPVQWAFPIEPTLPVRGQLGVWTLPGDIPCQLCEYEP